MRCPYCKELLTDANTSPASIAEGMCQECYTDMIETQGWR